MILLCCKSRVFREEVFCSQGSVQISLEIKSFEGISRAYARAFQTEFLIFCCHKCHTSPEKGRGKSQNEALEKASFDGVWDRTRRL